MTTDISSPKIVANQPTTTKDYIRQTALALFAEFGYENVTIRKICSKSRISVGTFYNNYSGKQDILLEIYDQIDNALKKIPVDLHLPFQDAVLLYVKTKAATVAEFDRNYDFSPVFKALQESESRSLKLEDREIFSYIFDATRKAQATGHVRLDMDARLISQRILRFLLGVIFDWFIRGCEYDLVKMVEDETRLYLDVFLI